MCPVVLALLIGSAAALALCVTGCAGQSNRVTVRPREIDDVLYNPGIGFTTFGNFDGDVPSYPKSTIAYFRWYWDAIEPRNGVYR